MARVQLATRVPNTIDFYPTHGLPAAVRAPIYRLYARLLIVEPGADARLLSSVDTGEAGRRIKAVVDTGSGISIFAYQTWKSFEQEIRWPKPVVKSGSPEPKVTVLGGKWPYRLGQIRIAAIDIHRNWFEPVWTLALFLENIPDAPNVNILGLGSSFFKHRQLRHAGYDPGELPIWWLEDVRE